MQIETQEHQKHSKLCSGRPKGRKRCAQSEPPARDVKVSVL